MITQAPDGEWYCGDCSQELNIDDLCVDSTPVRPTNSTPFKDREQSSLKVSPSSTAKKSKLSTPCSTTQSARLLAESFSPDSSSPEEDLYCFCRGKDEGNILECDGRNCTFQWFHFECVGITQAPDGEWYCDDCSQELNIDDSCVDSTPVHPPNSTPFNDRKRSSLKVSPSPTAKKNKLSTPCSTTRSARVLAESFGPDSSSPEYRAESNHQAVRQAIVNFMTHKDNAYRFCKDCFEGDTLAANLYEPIKSMTDYIKEKELDQRGWGTDREIRAFATLCQIDVCTYSDNGSSRAWLKFSPLFCNEHCMPKSDYKIYLFHMEERNLYDRVVPSV